MNMIFTTKFISEISSFITFKMNCKYGDYK